MAIASAPSVTNSGSLLAWKGMTAGVQGAPPSRAERNLTHVGTVLVAPGDNSTVPLGGTFDVWYDKASHNLLIDIASAQVGGPV